MTDLLFAFLKSPASDRVVYVTEDVLLDRVLRESHIVANGSLRSGLAYELNRSGINLWFTVAMGIPDARVLMMATRESWHPETFRHHLDGHVMVVVRNYLCDTTGYDAFESPNDILDALKAIGGDEGNADLYAALLSLLVWVDRGHQASPRA